MAQSDIDWVVLARLIRPQGRKGELLAELLTDFPERFVEGTSVFLAKPGFQGSAEEARVVELLSSWLPHGRNAGRIVLGFSGIGSIEAAEELQGLDVLVQDTDRVELTDGSMYIDDLVGCAVYDREVLVGSVSDVQFMTTADGRRKLTDAAPLLTVELESGEALIPFAKDLLVGVDLVKRRIDMKLPEGLIELNLKTIPPAV